MREWIDSLQALEEPDSEALLGLRNRLAKLRAEVGMVFQSFNLFPHMSVLDNITLAPRQVRKIPKRDAEEMAMALLERVRIPEQAKKYPGQLSGGQQQRVAIARALVTQPAILLADEPTGNLDSRSGTEILDFMGRAVRELGQTIVMVTHDPMAAGYADSAVFLADGRIVDEMREPTAERVLDRLKAFGE